jgi:hypothetical protein
MFKKALLLGIVSGLLAGFVSLAYSHIYVSSEDGTDGFLKIASPAGIIIGSLAGGVLAAIGYWSLNRLLKHNGEIVFNFLFVILSFAAMLPAFGAKLPRELTAPELFPGMVIPMHFFPALAWFTLKPLFFRHRRG